MKRNFRKVGKAGFEPTRDVISTDLQSASVTRHFSCPIKRL